MRPVFIIFIWLFAALASFAQEQEKTVDVVFLKNGTRKIGEIQSYEQGKELVLLDGDGDRIRIPDDRILKILQGVTLAEANAESADTGLPPQVFKLHTKGFYNTTLLAFAIGNGGTNSLALGAGLSSVVGYQVRPSLGIGLGIGLDNYARRGETIYPVFAEVRTFLPLIKKPNAYYLNLAGGYGLAFKRESIGVVQAKGGYMLHPAIGYRTATREAVEVNLDLGMKFQKAEFQHNEFNGDVRVRDLVFQRITLRVGLTIW